MARIVFRRLSSILSDKNKSFDDFNGGGGGGGGAAVPYPEDPDPWTPPPPPDSPDQSQRNGDRGGAFYARSTSVGSSWSSCSSSGASFPPSLARLCSIEATDEQGEWKRELTEAVADGSLSRAMELITDGHVNIVSPLDESVAAFVLVLASGANGQDVVEKASSCTDLTSFTKRGIAEVKFLILHAQRPDCLSTFFYSVLDVPVTNILVFGSHQGDVISMKNFLRFDPRVTTQSMVVLRSRMRSIDLIGYHSLGVLVLASCGLSKMAAVGLNSLEHLDLRKNHLATIPDGLLEHRRIRIMRVSGNNLRKIPDCVGSLEQLRELDCSRNDIKRLPSSIVNCRQLTILRCSDNDLVELPHDLGLLVDLRELRVHGNRISQLPCSIASLGQLQRLTFYRNPLQNIPSDFPERPGDVRKYFNSLQEHPVKNSLVKLVVVGQEGVGKTTLVKALRKTFWGIYRNSVPSSSRDLKKACGVQLRDVRLDDFTVRCFDCRGDVDFNETHNFFISPGAIYVVCFNMSDSCQSTVQTDSFLLGRVQLWLQYICSRVPNAQVLIVGTHADHPSVTRDVLEDIWRKIRGMLASERDKHQRYFGDRETLKDCLLCQSDTKPHSADQWIGTVDQAKRNGFVNHAYEAHGAEEEEEEEKEEEEHGTSVGFPHIVGYYKVSSVRGSTGAPPSMTSSSNTGVEGLREAIRELALRVIRSSPEVPRRWAEVRESLQSHVTRNPEASLLTVDEVSRLAHAHGVEDPDELVNMLQFFRAQGSLLYFPQLCDLQEIVVLDPEWLAGVFASLRSSRISDSGWMDRDQLKSSWTELNSQTRDRVLILLRYFGLCFPIDGTSLELFPSRLPFGEPDYGVWPSRPRSNQRHVTYSMTFPSSIPPPFFNTLMSTVYSYRAPSDDEDGAGTGCPSPRPLYFANLFLETLRPDSVGCGVCKTKRMDGTVEDLDDLVHQVLFQMIPHRRTIQVSARGALPCCLMRKVSKIIAKVVHSYDGLHSLAFDSIVCPFCVFEERPLPQRITWKALSSTRFPSSSSSSCRYGHSLPDSYAILTGSVVPPPEPLPPPRDPRGGDRSTDYTGCPRLFVILPVSHEGTAIGSRDRLVFASSLVFDGYAAHFVCESPEGYHVTAALGYRLDNPREFLKLYGARAVAVLRLLVGVETSSTSGRGDWTVDDLVRDLLVKFPVFKDTSANMKMDALRKFVDQEKVKTHREDLKRLLRLVDQPDRFGPLHRSTLLCPGQTIWLCHDHWHQMDRSTSRSSEETLLKDKRSQNNDTNNNR